MKARRLFIFTIGLLAAFALTGQTDEVGKKKKIIVENADSQTIDFTTDPPRQYLDGNVRVFHNGSFFFADRAIVWGDDFFAYGQISIIQNDTTSMYGDSVRYSAESEKANLMSNVRLISGRQTLSTTELEYDFNRKQAVYNQKAQMENGDYTLKSQRGIYATDEETSHFYGFVSIEGQDFRLNTDSLQYTSGNNTASWSSKALIKNNDTYIVSNEGRYDMNSKSGAFYNEAEIRDSSSVSKGDTILYFEETEIIELIGNASHVSTTDTSSGRYIFYDRKNEVAELRGKAEYKGPNEEARGEVIRFDKKTGAFDLEGEGQIKDGSTFISGQSVRYNTKEKEGVIVGDVLWQDTAQSTFIRCDSLIHKGREGYSRAMGRTLRPMLAVYPEGDTLFISADTLEKFREIRLTDSIWVDTSQNFRGYADVRIWNKDYQGICDSLVYRGTDSLFTLSGDPFLWQDSTQMSGDTILLMMKNDQLHQCRLQDQALILNSPDLLLFNQIGAQRIDIDFDSSRISTLKAETTAKSIYYMLDDEDAYIGVNRTETQLIFMDFKAGRISSIRYYLEPDSKVLPIRNTDHDALKLPGFEWKVAERPVSPESIRRLRVFD